MSQRWLSGFLIFALGFGCASLVTVATAQEVPEERGELEEGLDYVNTENEVRLVNSGKDVYVVMVQRSPGTSPAEAPVSYRKGVTTVPRSGLTSLKIYRLVAISELEEDFWRPCLGADCTWIGPLPPPPPPTVPPELKATFFTAQ
jgi:hypothetical protein